MRRRDDLPTEENDVLFDTFRAGLPISAWSPMPPQNCMSTRNTARHRLHRIERDTGRSRSGSAGGRVLTCEAVTGGG